MVSLLFQILFVKIIIIIIYYYCCCCKENHGPSIFTCPDHTVDVCHDTIPSAVKWGSFDMVLFPLPLVPGSLYSLGSVFNISSSGNPSGHYFLLLKHSNTMSRFNKIFITSKTKKKLNKHFIL